jgi:phosphohistidine phosphatase
MKTLILMRHAKSTWDYAVDDKDRPLEEKGIKSAHQVAKEFKNKNITIDAMYSSPAARALMTCMIVLRELKFPYNQFYCTNELYDFSGESVFQFVHQLNNAHEVVMIFGHNYAFTHVANAWGSQPIDNVPTGGLVQLDFDVNDWKSIKEGLTTQILFPKQLS